MSINQYLKKIGKKKVELAEELEISRPTLNQYIEIYEKGQVIENERYNIIFKRLFSDLNADRNTFDNILNAVKNLLERDKKYDIGCLDTKAADMVARIHNLMVQDMCKEGWDKKVYDTIIILLANYRNYAVFRELAGYFSDLNYESDLSELSMESKAYYSYYYRIFSVIRNSIPVFDQESYNEFVDRRKQISQQREERKKQRTQKVRDRLDSIVNEVGIELHESGMEVTEDEIMTEVIRRMNRIESE